MKLIAILLLGISMQYNISFQTTSDAVSVDETLDITITEEVLKSNNITKQDLIKKIEKEYLSSLNLSSYNTQKIDNGNQTILRLQKNFSNPYEYNNNTIFKNQLFGDLTITDFSAQEYNLSYNPTFFTENAKYLENSSYKMVFNVPYDVISHNASASNGTKYVWNILPQTSNINLVFNTLQANTNPTTTNNQLSFPIKFDFTTIMLIIIVGGLIGIGFYAFTLHNKNNSI